MSSIDSIARDYEQVSQLIADAILRRTNPVADEMSENEARKAYGTRWLNDKLDRGLVEFVRRGNKKIYSRHRLDCLRAAEKEHAGLILKSIKGGQS